MSGLGFRKGVIGPGPLFNGAMLRNRYPDKTYKAKFIRTAKLWAYVAALVALAGLIRLIIIS